MVGNVGGTLGLFVGFSFIASAEWLFLHFERLLLSLVLLKAEKTGGNGTNLITAHSIKKIVRIILYFVLLLCAFSFVLIPLLKSFLETRTNYSTEQHSLTFDDLPTLAICLELNGNKLFYGKTFKIDLNVLEEQTALMKNKKVNTLHVSELSLNELQQQTDKDKWQCYKITSKEYSSIKTITERLACI